MGFCNSFETRFSHTVLSAHLKCASRWFSYIHRDVQTSPLSILEHFHHPDEGPHTRELLLLTPPGRRPVSWPHSRKTLIYTHFCILDISCKQTHTRCGPLCPTLLIEDHVFKAHPRCDLSQCFVPSHGRGTSHCMGGPRSVSVICWWTCVCFPPPALVGSAAGTVCGQVSL